MANPGIGHNSGASEEPKLGNVAGVDSARLRSFVERIERLEEEKKAIADDVKDVYLEAKGTGYDAKIIRQVIRLRKQDQEEREEQESLLDTYLIALGMKPGTEPEDDPEG